mmetsp:Transcript_35057/g.54779  ORF Transcript_35057/g.54779 Transcript_35057/m.54779 type:complete len:268 (-) Transcript_35057:130-933(-)
MPGYNARGQSSTIGDLLKDPSTPKKTPQRPSTAHTPSRRNVLTGMSEREDPGGLRKFHGCSVYGEAERKTAMSNRKNYVSTPDSEYKHVKGKQSVNSVPIGSINPLTQPNSVSADLTHKKYLGRMSDHHGNIIREPPAEERNLKPTKNREAGHRVKQKFDHGDIINGKNQTLTMSSGKGRACEFSTKNRSTVDLLHWPGPETPQKRSGAADRRGNSDRMQAALSQSRPTTAPPSGQSSIERLAQATAFAVIAPRSNAAGSGIADLQR